MKMPAIEALDDKAKARMVLVRGETLFSAPLEVADGYVAGASTTVSAAQASVAFTGLPARREIRFSIRDLSHDGAGSTTLEIAFSHDAGANYGSTITVSGSVDNATLVQGEIVISDTGEGVGSVSWTTIGTATAVSTIAATYPYTTTGANTGRLPLLVKSGEAIDAVRIQFDGEDTDAGTISYQVR